MQTTPRVSTGLAGLDSILDGGFVANRLYLAEGAPGTGKTTLALHFLLDGARRGEKVLYVTLAETKEELEDVARSHGWTLDGIDVFELVPPEASLDREREQTLLHPSEVELGETTQLIFDRVIDVTPTRVVFDSLSEMRLLARNSLRYRRQVLALKHFFRDRNCTVLLLDDSTAEEDAQLHSVPHGVIQLEQVARDYGTERRRLRVVKMRGVAFRGGYHDLVILTGGIRVYPRIVVDPRTAELGPIVDSGIGELDTLLGGGLARGTNTLLIGPSGSGKTTLALQYAMAGAQRGETAMLFSFDESLPTLHARCTSFGMPIQEYLANGRLRMEQVDPAEMSRASSCSTRAPRSSATARASSLSIRSTAISPPCRKRNSWCCRCMSC
jgi:circadian clock protein KaiC